MQLSDLSVKRPVFAAVVAMLIAVVGIVGFFGLSVREYPDVDPPVVSVQTQYIGAAANVVETRITEVLEDAARRHCRPADHHLALAGRPVDHHPRIHARHAISTTPPTTCATGSARRRAQLPPEIDPPVVRKVDADAWPIMFLVVSRPGWTPLQLTDWVDRNLVDRFSRDRRRRPGVHRRRGAASDADLAPARAAGRLRPHPRRRRGRARRAQNVELPAGRLEAQQNVTLRVARPSRPPSSSARWSSAAAPTAIWSASATSRGSSGPGKSLCRVPHERRAGRRPRHRPPVERQHAGGRRRRQGEVEQVRPTLPEGMTIGVGSDDSAVHQPRHQRGAGRRLPRPSVLVVLVIYLFLGSWRATLIPAVTVPVCLLASFAVLWAARILDQPADPACAGAGHRHRRRRRDRRAREHPAPDRGRRAAAGRRLSTALARSASRSSRRPWWCSRCSCRSCSSPARPAACSANSPRR